MEWLLAAVVLAVVGVRSVLRRGAQERSGLVAAQPAEPMSQGDWQELEQSLAAIEAEGSSRVRSLLEMRLGEIAAHGTPVRALTRSPTHRVGRLRFADGTTFLVTGQQPGQLVSVAVALQRGPVRLDRWFVVAGQHRVVLAKPPGPHVELIVTGLDQAD